jgi:hypothetical protein
MRRKRCRESAASKREYYLHPFSKKHEKKMFLVSEEDVSLWGILIRKIGKNER